MARIEANMPAAGVSQPRMTRPEVRWYQQKGSAHDLLSWPGRHRRADHALSDHVAGRQLIQTAG